MSQIIRIPTDKNEKTRMEDQKNSLHSGVDRGLVAMFLKMTPEERVRSNDNAINAIKELKNAFRQ